LGALARPLGACPVFGRWIYLRTSSWRERSI